jgi:hypothetical protein
MTWPSVELMRRWAYKSDREQIVRELCPKIGWCQRSEFSLRNAIMVHSVFLVALLTQ